MPTYDYTCKDCKKDFTVMLSVKEAEKKPAIACEHCKSTRVEKRYGAFTAVTSKKS